MILIMIDHYDNDNEDFDYVNDDSGDDDDDDDLRRQNGRFINYASWGTCAIESG